MSRCFIAFGSNQGQSARTFDLALKTLDSHPRFSLKNASSYYRSAAMGPSAGSDFLNAVAEFETDWSPTDILEQLRLQEDRSGRQKTSAWGPRTLDLDLLYVDDLVQETAELTLPHPGAWYRRFVLMPMCEIAPEFKHPVYEENQSELLTRIDRRPLRIQLIGCDIYSGNIEDLDRRLSEVTFESPLLPDPSEGLIVVGRRSEGLKENVPQVDLSTLPGNNLEALESVLQAVIGHCEKAN
jgi:2-amino-4-hydroxy-6-hydroxymethyldihydropteridine diphosphokinase